MLKTPNSVVTAVANCMTDSSDKKDRNSPTTCVLPWIQVSTKTDGRLQLCCFSDPEANDIVDDNQKPVYIQNISDYEEFWNNTQLKELRRQMIRGERPQLCEGCYRVDDSGARSSRQQKNIDFEKSYLQIPDITKEDGSAPVQPRYLDIRLANICNLRCRMCNPYSSNSWVDDWKSIFTFSEKATAGLDQLKSLKWTELELFWKTLEKYSGTIEQVFFAGGEPALIQQQYQFLNNLIEQGRAEEISLSYTTNLTHLPEKLLELWSRFKEIRIFGSLDAYGDLNHYIRYPTRWEDVDQNLQRLDRMADTHPQMSIQITSTLQVFNAFQFHHLTDYLQGFKYVHRLPEMTALYTPDYLDLRVLPLELKQEAQRQLELGLRRHTRDLSKTWGGFTMESDRNWIRTATDIWQRKVMQIVEHMMSEDMTHLLPELKRITSILDHRREQKLKDVFPELAEHLKKV